MDTVSYFLSHLFDTDNWPPRWLCGKWSSFHGWLYIISDLAIWGAYFTIPFTMLVFMVKRKQDIPFMNVFWLFALFIILCGSSHFIDAAIFWIPVYRFSAIILFLTAVVSWVTVVALIRVMPQAIQLKSPKQLETIIEGHTAELLASNRKLFRINNEMDSFVYSASHDLKSPVNNLEGLIYLLKEQQAEGHDISSIVEKMNSSVNRMKKTINSLAEVLKAGKTPSEDIQRVNLEEMIHEIFSENENIICQPNILITLDLQQRVLNHHPTVLKSILYTLISNAIKYRSLERKSWVHVRTYNENNAVIMEVSDNGLGIDLKRYGYAIFKMFRRFHDHVDGSGLGLYMIKRMIDEAGGSIVVQSWPGEGSIFTVTMYDKI